MNGRKLYNKVCSLGAEAAVLFDEISMQYLSGFFSTDGFVLVDRDETALVIDSRYYEAASRLKDAGELPEDVGIYLLERSLTGMLAELVGEKKITSLCFDSDRVTVSRSESLHEYFPSVRLIGKPDLCGEFRRVKSEKEIEYIRAAQQITDTAFSHILGFIRPGVTERQVAAELEYAMRREGADGFAFETIAVSGLNSSLPHGVPSDAVLTENSFLTMDFGARYKGYCSDMTRTVVLGKASDEMRRIYGTVLEAQRLGIEAARPGVTGAEVDSAARSYIDSQGYAGRFGHSLGHSLGLEIHENPRFSSRSDDVFVPGNVMTVEPGIYIPGFGGCRIEDMVLITETGCIDLTSSPKELIEL